MGQKFRGLRPLFGGGGAGSTSNTKSPRAKVYLHTKWNLDLCSHLAATDMGRKLAAVALWGEVAGSPSNSLWPGPRPTCMSSFILIRHAVWPQYTNVTDRTDRQDRQDRQHRANSFINGRPKTIERMKKPQDKNIYDKNSSVYR